MKTKVINISIPSQLLDAAEELAQQEYRNRSELFREALRSYILSKKDLSAVYSYGQQQAKKEKITTGNLNQAIEDYRKNK
ncbi:MAG: hypothetical protein ACD_58C00336G0001 [uncultured bacterium]|nr:MAG: hypothetical protein ACD_58C00336G0001 [uncultured bacterium]